MIWNHKTYLSSPLLVKEDQLIKKHRRWYSQFFSESSPRLSMKKETLDWWCQTLNWQLFLLILALFVSFSVIDCTLQAELTFVFLKGEEKRRLMCLNCFLFDFAGWTSRLGNLFAFVKPAFSSASIRLLISHYGYTGFEQVTSWKTWKVMKFNNFIFQAWKVMEFHCSLWKVVEN